MGTAHLPSPTKMTGVLTLRRREMSTRPLLEFPIKGKNLPVRNATNCSLQSAGASGGNREGGSETEAKAKEFYERKIQRNKKRDRQKNKEDI